MDAGLLSPSTLRGSRSTHPGSAISPCHRIRETVLPVRPPSGHPVRRDKAPSEARTIGPGHLLRRRRLSRCGGRRVRHGVPVSRCLTRDRDVDRGRNTRYRTCSSGCRNPVVRKAASGIRRPSSTSSSRGACGSSGDREPRGLPESEQIPPRSPGNVAPVEPRPPGPSRSAHVLAC